MSFTNCRLSVHFLQYEDTSQYFRAGETIFAEGQTGRHMYVVKEGSVELRVARKPVELLRAGDFMGEMALLDSNVRSATAVAVTDCRLAEIDSERFEYLIRQSPNFAKEILFVMSGRLRKMNREMAAMHKIADDQRTAFEIPPSNESLIDGIHQRVR